MVRGAVVRAPSSAGASTPFVVEIARPVRPARPSPSRMGVRAAAARASAPVGRRCGPPRRRAACAVTAIISAAALKATFDDPTAHAHTDAAAIYAQHCAPCHGADGRGDGPGAYLLVTPPRDFHRAQYRLVSTWERTPTDDDLFAAITRGLPGTPMPSWSPLPDPARRALVALLKTFADPPWTAAPSGAPAPDVTGRAGVIVVPPEPADARTNHTRAYTLFRDACAPCHGATG